MFFFLLMLPESERDTFLYLYEKYKRLMLRKAAAILGDAMLAEDAVSEAFIRLYKNLDKIDDPDSGRCAAFVFTIVKNTALTLRRREIVYISDPDAVLEAEDSFDLEEQVLAKMTSERVLQLLDSLSEDLRQVFLLKYGRDLPHKEIARLLGITENNVTVRLHRARAALSKLLAKEELTLER